MSQPTPEQEQAAAERMTDDLFLSERYDSVEAAIAAKKAWLDKGGVDQYLEEGSE